jgi:site-specific recombinase XerD
MGHSPKTLEWYSNSVASLVTFLEGAGESTDIADLAVDHVRAWVNDQRARGLAPKTLKTRVTAIKALTKWATEEDIIRKDPLARMKAPKAVMGAKPVFEPEEVDQLLAACDPRTLVGIRDRAIILILYSTAMRSAECCQLHLDDIDWSKGLVIIQRGKGGKPRVVPLTGKAEKALDRYTRHPQRKDKMKDPIFLTDQGTPLTAVGFRQIFKRLSARTGLAVNPHKFRYSAAIQYLRNGGKLETLKALLGHSSLDMTLHYARIAGVDVGEAHQTADPARSLKTRG